MNSRSEVLARTLPTQPHTAFILLPGQWQNGTTKSYSKTVPSYFPGAPPSRLPNPSIPRNSAILNNCKDIAFLSPTPSQPQPACPLLVFRPPRSFHLVLRLEDFFLGGTSGEFSNSFTRSIGFTRARSTVSPQCKCGPVTRPVAPTFPTTVPASRTSPAFTSISERCP